jgi:hypothetical protein
VSPAFDSIAKRDDFVLAHGDFARSIALCFRAFARRIHVDYEDVLQDAYLGLLLGCETWNPDAWPDAEYRVFFRLWIKATIRRGLSRSGHSPDLQRIERGGELFGSVMLLPDGCEFPVRSMRSKTGHIVWMVGVTAPLEKRPKKYKRKKKPRAVGQAAEASVSNPAGNDCQTQSDIRPIPHESAFQLPIT